MASKLYNRFKMDADREEAGAWADFGDGIRVKVRRLKSRKSVEVRRELDKPFQDVIRRGPLPTDKAEELLIRQLAGGVIADWEGIEDEDGNPLPYNADNAFKILTDLAEFRDEIFRISVDADVFKARVTEDAVGN